MFVSGAAGFIGGAITRELLRTGYEVTGGVRNPGALPPGAVMAVTGDLADARIDLRGVEAVVHAAGLGHRRGVAPEQWRRANIDAAINLAQQARAANVPRFVLISTAHVHGRVHEGVVTDDSSAQPMDGYATSKLDAEYWVSAIFGHGLTVIRPVAVIGPACPGNLPILLRLLQAGAPLPFASIANRRSFIAVDDLAALVETALRAAAPPAVILAAHPGPVSTPDLIRSLAKGMGVADRLFAVPPAALATAARLLRRTPIWQSLAGDFIAAPQAALALGWQPRQSLQASLAETARYYSTTINSA